MQGKRFRPGVLITSKSAKKKVPKIKVPLKVPAAIWNNLLSAEKEELGKITEKAVKALRDLRSGKFIRMTSGEINLIKKVNDLINAK